ncbi:MAG: MFS transporter [Methermicoccaceae archaeon]
MNQRAPERAVLVYFGVFFIMGLSGVIVPILDLLAHDPFWSSVLFSAYSVGALLSLIPFGVLTDRYGAPPMLVLSLVLTALSGVGLLVFSDASLLTAARLLEGAGCGAFFPSALSLLSAHPNYPKRAVMFNLLMSAGLAGGGIAGGALAHIATKGGIWLFTLPLIPVVLYAVLGTRWKDIPAHPSYGKSFTGVMNQAFRLFFSPKLSSLWLLCVVAFGTTGAVMALYSFYTAESMSRLTLGVAIGSVYLGGMIASPIASYAKLSVSHMLRAGTVLTALGILTTVYTPLGPIIFGLGSGLVFIGAVVYTSQMARSTLSTTSGLLMGTLSTMVYIGFAVVPLTSGLLYPTLSLAHIIVLNALIVLAATMLPIRREGLGCA